MYSNVACFYHPITVLFLDDSKNFLATLELELANQGNMITCTDPEKASKLIDGAQSTISEEILKSLDKREVDTATDYLVDLDIKKLHKLIYSPERFKRVAVLVVDYQMPEINGTEFCRSIQNKQLCKIMLTAEADQSTAINAFNDGLIDKFLLKQDESLYQGLTNAIAQLKQRYFNRLSHIILENLGKDFKALLSDKQFQELFCKIQKDSNAVEYYLVDPHGSFLFLDEKANPTWLIVRSEKELDEQVSIAEGLGASFELLESLNNREKLLFMFSESDYKRPIGDWSSLLVDANKFNDTHYYSVFSGKLTDQVDWEKVKGYR